MNIRGLYKTSLLDYPGRICSVIFTGGCNLRCRYCHNPELALNSPELERIEQDSIIEFLQKRKGRIDGITVTGGEPALNPGLAPFLKRVKDLGLLVKLDSNGFFPDAVRKCVDQGLVDYAALDMKTSPEKYSDLTCASCDFYRIIDTIDVLKKGNVDFELRTTCVPGYVTVDDIDSIGNALGGVKNYFLQQFVSTGPMIDSAMNEVVPYKAEYLHLLRERVLLFAETCSIRGL